MLSDTDLQDANRITTATCSSNIERRKKNCFRRKTDNVKRSSMVSTAPEPPALALFSPFMLSLDLSSVMTPAEPSSPTNYLWSEDITRFSCGLTGFEDTWKQNKNEGLAVAAHSESEDMYSFLIPQFDGTSDEISGSHEKSDQQIIPATGSQHENSSQATGSSSERWSSRHDFKVDGALGLSWNARVADREIGNPEMYSPERKPQPKMRQTWPQQQQYQCHQDQILSPLPSQNAAFQSSSPSTFQSPTHNPHASPGQQQALPTPSPPHLHPYQLMQTDNPDQHQWQSPPYTYSNQSSQPGWSFRSPPQLYKSSSTYQPFEAASESCKSQPVNKPYHSESYKSLPANKPYQSPIGGERESAYLLYDSLTSDRRSPPDQLHQFHVDHLQPTYQAPSQAPGMSHPQRCPHPPVFSIHGSCSPGHSVWRPDSYLAHSQSHMDTHNLTSWQNPRLASSSPAVNSYVKGQYSGKDTPAAISDCDSVQLDSQNQMFPHNSQEDTAASACIQSSCAGVAHTSVPAMKCETTSLYSVTSISKQTSFNKRKGLGNSPELQVDAVKAYIGDSSVPILEDVLVEKSAKERIKKVKQTAFIKQIIDSPTPPVPGRGQRSRAKLGLEVLGRSRSTSLSSPVSLDSESFGYSQSHGNTSLKGQPGLSQFSLGPLNFDSRIPSPMHSSDWQLWKEENFPPGSQWQQLQTNECQSFDKSEEVDSSSLALNVNDKFEHKLDNIKSSHCDHDSPPGLTPLFTNTQKCLENDRAHNSWISSSGCSSCSSVKDRKKSVSSHRHLFSQDFLQGAALALSVPIHTDLPRKSCSETMPCLSAIQRPVRPDSMNVETRCRQEDVGAVSESASFIQLENQSHTDLDVIRHLKPEIIRRSDSLNGMGLPENKQGIDLELTDNVSHDGDSASAAYTFTFDVPAAGVKKLGESSNSDSRKDRTEVAKMHPVNAPSLGNNCSEVVKAGRLNGDLIRVHPSSHTCPDKLEFDYSGLSGFQDDSKAATLSTLNTDCLKNIAHDQSSISTNQLSLAIGGTSTAVNDLSTIDSDGQGLNPASVQSMDAPAENSPCTCRFAERANLYELFQDNVSRHTKSQLSENNFGVSLHQRMPKLTSCGSYSTSPPIDIDQKDVARSHLFHLQQQQQQPQHSQIKHSHHHCHRHHHHQQQHHHHQPQLQQEKSQWQQQWEHSKHTCLGRNLPEHPGVAGRHPAGIMSDSSCEQEAHNRTNIVDSCSLKTTTQQGGPCWTLKKSVMNHRQSGQNRDSYSNSTHLSIRSDDDMKQLDRAVSYAARRNESEYSDENAENSLLLTRTSGQDVVHSKCSGKEEVPEQPVHLAECDFQTGEQKVKLSSRKNVKSLCLTIPKPRSHVNMLDVSGAHTSSEDTETSSTSGSQREFSGSESNKKDSMLFSDSQKKFHGIESNKNDSILAASSSQFDDSESNNNSSILAISVSHRDFDGSESNKKNSLLTFRRSRRRSRVEDVNVEAEGKQNQRKTKIQCAHSKNPHVLKLKKRKTPASLVEGVHYVVVGKFKGHQAMLVKTRKLNMTPAERVQADHFEKLAEKEIVRQVSSVSSSKRRMFAGESEVMIHLCDTTESPANTSLHNLESKNAHIDHDITRIQSFLETGKGRTDHSSLKDRTQPKHSVNKTKTKNIFACLTKEICKDSIRNTRLKEDHFFFRFKESFIKHNKGKEQTTDLELQDYDNVFFEGVKRSSFCNFQQRFLSNILKLKTGEYSSSSDDEDDVLDKTILKKRIGLSHVPGVSQCESNPVLLKPIKCECSAATRNSQIGHPAESCTLSNQLTTCRHHLDSPKQPENGQIIKWSSGQRPTSAAESVLDATNTTIYSEEVCQPAEWIDKFQEGVETDKERPALKEYNKYIHMTLNSSAEQKTVCQQEEEEAIEEKVKEEEVKEDYLKCQMVFFEDITSDSESNDTIIVDNSLGKGNACQRDTTAVYPPFSVIAACPETLCKMTNIPAQQSGISTGPVAMMVQRHIESNDERSDHIEQPEQYKSALNETQITATKIEQGLPSGTLDRANTPVSLVPSDFSHVLKLSSQQKNDLVLDENDLPIGADILQVSQDVFGKGGESLLTTAGNSDESLEFDKFQAIHQNMKKAINMSMNQKSDTESMFCANTHHKKRRRRKLIKRIQIQSENVTQGRQTLEEEYADEDSWCPGGAGVFVEPMSQNKSLPERKKTLTSYAESLDSDNDVSSDSSDEDYTVPSARQKGGKINRRTKRRNIDDRSVRKPPKVNMDSGKATKRGQKAGTSRGRKKKPPGGDKLLSSLSLLHMATLANLTEVTSDLPDNQTFSGTAMHIRDDCTDNSLSSAADDLFLYSSQYEEDSASFGSKGWICARKRKSTKEDSALSKKLLKRQANMKYGHVSSDSSRHSVSLAKLVNNLSSSSPVPSNFMFNHNSDPSCQTELTNVCEDAGPSSTTLQLLETRRAQVNCASFSMKDILKLTTPDDSMDSDSWDSFALVRPPASKKAQVKSTTLSMSDILKLTNASSHGEPVHTTVSSGILSDSDFFMSRPSTSKTSKLEASGAEMFTPICQPSVGAVVTPSCAALPKVTDVMINLDHIHTNSSKVPDCAVSQLKQCSHPQYITHTESCQSGLLQPENSQTPGPEECAEESSFESSQGVLKESTILRIQLGKKKHTKSVVPVSDSLKGVIVVQDLDTNFSGNIRSRPNEVSEFQSEVDTLKEPHKQADISSHSFADTSSQSPVVLNTTAVDEKSPCQTLSASSLFHNVTTETIAASFPGSPLTSRSILKTQCTSQSHREREDSENVVISQRTHTTTKRMTSEAAGVSSPSVSPLEELDKLSYESLSLVPSQAVLEASVPGTSVSPVVKTARLSGASDTTSFNQKLSFGSSEFLSAFSKQENKGNHKNVNVRNVDRGIRPLHPLQIPHYSLMEQNFPSQVENILRNTKQSSLYYPHCWQWPVHTPGSDVTVSPLNLCNSHKSPNNYSPITPTSPVSPDYPTQAQGVTEFDKSSKVTEGKPLWYPWLKVEPDRSETRMTHVQPPHTSDEYKIQVSRHTRIADLVPTKQTEEGEASSSPFQKATAGEIPNEKQDAKASIDLQKQSPNRSKDSTLKSGLVKPHSGTITMESSSSPGVGLKPISVIGDESVPSTSCTEPLAGAELTVPQI